MTPRIFVSSTYFDLRHVRERIEKFIQSYGFEPVLFESDKVTYEHNKPVDFSAYAEVNLCHVMLLIIGGRYGTAATIQTADLEKKNYNEGYVSITRRELETAIALNMPIYIFIDKNVHSEYQTYKENQDYFEYITKEKNTSPIFKFAHVDDINIFRFIDLVRNKPIKTFDKVDEIEHYLKHQFAGLFYSYLENLKKESEKTKILDTVSELNNVALRMNEMLTSVGKKILGNENEEYEEVIFNQLKIIIKSFTEHFYQYISFENEYSNDVLNDININEIVDVFVKVCLYDYNLNDEKKKYSAYRDIERNLLDTINKELTQIDPRVTFKKIDIFHITIRFKQNVEPFINNVKNGNDVLKEEVSKTFLNLLAEFPF